MSIPAVTLDDLTWTDLTAAARRRIPAASKGKWTLHAPVDPGVTLLELHAWLLEQRLYWMDQVPDALTRGALALLGERARDAQCAATVFQFTASQPGSVPAGTQMTLADSDPPLIFTTDTDLMVLPFARDIRNGVEGPPLIGLRLGPGTDRAIDLMAGREVCLFEQPGVDVEITLRLTQAILPANLAEIALLFLLGSDTVAPQWSADAAAAPPPASLSWWYASAPSGARKRFAQVSDGTGGLRRSGIVRFALPGDWYAPAPGGDGIRSYSLWVRAETAAFTAPPRLAGLAPNAVIARHRRRWLQLRPDIDWLPLPNNSIPLGTEAVPPLTDRASLRIRERDDRWHKWHPTADLAFHGREDRVFVIDRCAGALSFGNGETGRIPVLGWGFSVRDVTDPVALALAWHTLADPISTFLQARLSPQQAAVIAAVSSNPVLSRALLRTLLAVLNGVLDEPAFYDAQRFAAVTLRDPTRALIGTTYSTQTRRRLNRMLLEDAYPTALARGAVYLDLQLGGGTAGNVGAQRSWEPTAGQAIAPELQAINVIDATGGAEPELLGDARQRAASGLRRVERAVIADDYETLARTTPGVAIRRARVAIGVSSEFPCAVVPGAVTVYIVPDAPRDDKACAIVVAPQPDAGALAAVTARLDAARLLGTELDVRAPIYRDIAVAVDVEADTDASDAMRADVAAWLGRFLDPLVGGDQQTGWPFGGPLTPSVLLRRAQDVIGDRGEVVRVGIRRLGTDTEDENCNDVDIGPNALPALRQVTTRVTASRATIGGLQ
ncbi:MAG TPA: baseplate J/gp47 family protein [Bradyrhizobium sp.]|jgi:hypothetical protein|nr:baseplate J/gp47 family protein [Bradyrhizobium sp.]